MACSCKCCCGCCCDGETGEQKLERQCTSPKEFQGKGTICDVCCDLGEIREDITEESECPGTWVVNGRCLDEPCDSECEPIDGVPTFRVYYSPEFCEPFCLEQEVIDTLPYDSSSFAACCAYNASINFAPGIGPCESPSECETNGDCNEGQHCCDGQCEDPPCPTRWPPDAPRPDACSQCAATETCYTRNGVFVRCVDEGNPLP
jgi:hypothetical protein